MAPSKLLPSSVVSEPAWTTDERNRQSAVAMMLRRNTAVSAVPAM
jgi:hypothetical protein